MAPSRFYLRYFQALQRVSLAYHHPGSSQTLSLLTLYLNPPHILPKYLQGLELQSKRRTNFVPIAITTAKQTPYRRGSLANHFGSSLDISSILSLQQLIAVYCFLSPPPDHLLGLFCFSTRYTSDEEMAVAIPTCS